MGWTPSVAIVGSGVGGICMATQLKEQLGFTNFTIFEKDHEVGGTWLVNTYPGCACDVSSHVYSFSFALNPNWSSRYAGSKEIHQYLKDVVDKFEIRSYIKLNTEVTTAIWKEDKKEWCLTIKHNGKEREESYNLLVLGSGPLRIPNIPEKLISKYTGEWIHTAKWKEDFDMTDKNIAIIGNGASAVQVIPNIVDEVGQLYVYQRTPSWIMPRDDFPYSENFKQILRWSPKFNRLYRWYLFAKNELLHLAFKRNTFFTPVVTKLGRLMFEGFLNKQVPSEPLRKVLRPDYEPGCKRIILANNYYTSFLRPNVHLVTEPIKEISGNVIRSGEGTQTKVDAIILATGFRPDLFIAPMTLIGREGVEVSELWEKAHPQAYYGFCCNQFPNSFILLGPNSALGHNSVIYMIECQVAAIIKIIKEMMEKDIASVEVKREVQQKQYDELQKHLVDTVWASGCKSWYYSEEKGNFTIWPHSCIQFWRETRQITIAAFDVKYKK